VFVAIVAYFLAHPVRYCRKGDDLSMWISLNDSSGKMHFSQTIQTLHTYGVSWLPMTW